MSLRARGLALSVVCALLLVGIPSEASETSGMFSDDDGIPEERNIDHLAGLGIVEACDPPANRFCPDEALTVIEAVRALVHAESYLRGRVPARVLDFHVEGLARLLSRVQIIDADTPVSEPVLTEAITHSLGLEAPSSLSSSPTDSLSRAEMAEILARALGEDRCSHEPFTAERVSSLAERHPRQTLQAYVYDTHTGCAYWMNPDARLRTASVFKVMVMAGTLLEAQEDDRQLTEPEWESLVPMITESANWPVRSLWRRYGAAPWFGEQGEVFGLDQTVVIGDDGRSWGATRTSAKDQADLIRQVLVGEWGPLESQYRDVARGLMTSVIESQTWGITAGVPESWTVAQKNGFAGSTTNSVGYVEAPEGDRGYVIAVLTNGWPGWRSGVETVEEIAGWVSSALIAER